jgi:hypothetical protein
MTKTTQLDAPRQDSAGGTGIRPAVLLAGAAMIVTGAVQVDGAILTQAYRGASPVAEDRLTFPWDGATAVATTLTWGLTQLLLVGALVVWARSGATGPSRGGRIGAALTVVGGALLASGYGLTLAALSTPMDDPGAVAVLALFGVGTLVSLVGFLLAGVATLRAGRWTSWRRYAPLAVAVAMLVVMPLQFTPLLPVAVGLYGLTIVALGVAMLAEGSGPR